MECISCKTETTICVKKIYFCFSCFEKKLIKKVRQKINQVCENKLLIYVSCTRNSFLMLHILNKIFKHRNKFDCHVLIDKDGLYNKIIGNKYDLLSLGAKKDPNPSLVTSRTQDMRTNNITDLNTLKTRDMRPNNTADMTTNSMQCTQTNNTIDMTTNNIQDAQTNNTIDMTTNNIQDAQTNNTIDMTTNNMQGTQTNNTIDTSKSLTYGKLCDDEVQNAAMHNMITNMTKNIKNNITHTRSLPDNIIEFDAAITSLSINEISIQALKIIIEGNGNEACNFASASNRTKEYRVFECITDYELNTYYNEYKHEIPELTFDHIHNQVEKETMKFVNGLNENNYSTSFNIIETLKKIGKK